MHRELAREMRENPTEPERLLWWRLRLGAIGGNKFRRQVPMRSYIVDFLCFEHRLIIELDGSRHATNREADQVRTARLNSQGFRVVRFWNNQVIEDLDAVVAAIAKALGIERELR